MENTPTIKQIAFCYGIQYAISIFMKKLCIRKMSVSFFAYTN